MVNIASAIRNTVPISLFNRGLAGKIFDEVKQSGAKVVMKNNAAECVLMSPEEYMSLIDEVNDARLLTMASERMAKADPAAFVPAEHLYEELGMNLSTAFNIFVRQSLRERGIPFKITEGTPSKETVSAMLEAERIAKDPTVKGYHDVDEFFANLDS